MIWTAAAGLTEDRLEIPEYKPEIGPDASPRNLDLRDFLLWLGIIERWPEVRVAFQDAGERDAERRLAEIYVRYRGWEEGEPPPIPIDSWVREAKTAIVERLPRREDAPELTQVFRLLMTDSPFGSPFIDNLARKLLQYDQAPLQSGL